MEINEVLLTLLKQLKLHKNTRYNKCTCKMKDRKIFEKTQLQCTNNYTRKHSL